MSDVPHDDGIMIACVNGVCRNAYSFLFIELNMNLSLSVRPIACVLIALTGLSSVFADDEAKEFDSLEDLADMVSKRVVLIETSGRRGETVGLGSGFIIREDGLIATCFHVIGQGRHFSVKLPDDVAARPTEIVAYDRDRDLALIKVDRKGLPTLDIADSDKLTAAQPVLAVGNPLGFERSVADGVVAGQRSIDDSEFVQLAMPVEPGSSGSPVVDRKGRVVGMIAIKSGSSTAFAVPSNAFKPLVEKPHPIPFNRWLTIGSLNPKRWMAPDNQPEVRWRQRAGRIIASGMGRGFGGRTLCLATMNPPEDAFEVEVDVKLDDSSGAAGIAFHADGGNRHYGYYVTNGQLRLTRFEGPNVFTWTILDTVSNKHHRVGEWNRLRLKLDGHNMKCFVNDELAIEAVDRKLTNGSVGLIKFREPTATFKGFRVEREILPRTIPDEVTDKVTKVAGEIQPRTAIQSKTVEGLVSHGEMSIQVLQQQAKLLEARAKKIKDLADAIHVELVAGRLRKELDKDEKDIDLLQATLLVALLDNRELELEPYHDLANQMAEEIQDRFKDGMSDGEKLDELVKHFAQRFGFHGSYSEYYHRSNSYINEVMDDREGLPITLSVVLIELGRRTGLPIVGVGIPRHFLVRFEPEDKEQHKLIDVFDNCEFVDRDEAETLAGQDLNDVDFETSSKKDIVTRILRNLLGVARQDEDMPGMLRYLNLILAVDEEAIFERWIRAVARMEQGDLVGSAEDLDWLIARQPEGMNLHQVLRVREMVRQRMR